MIIYAVSGLKPKEFREWNQAYDYAYDSLKEWTHFDEPINVKRGNGYHLLEVFTMTTGLRLITITAIAVE